MASLQLFITYLKFLAGLIHVDLGLHHVHKPLLKEGKTQVRRKEIRGKKTRYEEHCIYRILRPGFLGLLKLAALGLLFISKLSQLGDLAVAALDY